MKKIPDEIVLKSVMYNPHGFGVVFLDTGECIRTLDMGYAAECLLNKDERPFIAHCRLKTVGEVTEENVHPYPMGKNRWLFMNGTVKTAPKECESDTAAVANALATLFPRKKLIGTDIKQILEMTEARWALVEGTDYALYNENDYLTSSKESSVKYSKPNVLTGNIFAAYGKMKKGFSMNTKLSGCKFMGEATTVEKEHMVVYNKIPYLLQKKKKDDDGKNVEMELFRLSDTQIKSMANMENEDVKLDIVEVENKDGIKLYVYTLVNTNPEVDNGKYHSKITHEDIYPNVNFSHSPRSYGLFPTISTDTSLEDGFFETLKSYCESPFRGEVNMLGCDGLHYYARLEVRLTQGTSIKDIEGKVAVKKNKVYLCNNDEKGSSSIANKFGYNHAMIIGRGTVGHLHKRNITKLEVYTESWYDSPAEKNRGNTPICARRLRKMSQLRIKPSRI